MNQEILISITSTVTKIAIVEDSIITEIIVARNDNISLVGNVYKGQITRILPGMKAAFVDIGLKQPAFLQSDSPPHQGRTVIVQVTKEPMGTKQARLTTKISIPSRYIILLPYSSNLVKISSRIKSSEERQRLENIFLSNSSKYGLIIRTAAEGISERLLLNDLEFLYNLWQDIQDTRINSLIYRELPIYLRAIRDLAKSSSCKIKIDSYEIFQEITEFANQFIPNLVPYVEYYSAKRSLFELYSININKYLEPKVKLDSGGYIVIESTEEIGRAHV